MSKRTTVAGLTIVVTAVALSSCGSSAAEQAATAAYDACVKPDAETQVLVHDGNTVAIEIKGEAARALSGMEEETDALLAGDEDASLDGMGVGLAMIFAQDCLVEETGYPGSSDQLEDGDEWDGWRYSTDEGAGSEFTASFTATS